MSDQLRESQATVAERDAQVQHAEAQLIESNLELYYCEARAPVDGVITKRNVQLGSYLSVGTLMFLIVSPNVWVTAKLRWNLSFYSFAALASDAGSHLRPLKTIGLPDRTTRILPGVSPQLVQRVHKLYEELGRQDIRAVQDWEKAQEETRKERSPK